MSCASVTLIVKLDLGGLPLSRDSLQLLRAQNRFPGAGTSRWIRDSITPYTFTELLYPSFEDLQEGLKVFEDGQTLVYHGVLQCSQDPYNLDWDEVLEIDSVAVAQDSDLLQYPPLAGPQELLNVYYQEALKVIDWADEEEQADLQRELSGQVRAYAETQGLQDPSFQAPEMSHAK